MIPVVVIAILAGAGAVEPSMSDDVYIVKTRSGQQYEGRIIEDGDRITVILDQPYEPDRDGDRIPLRAGLLDGRPVKESKRDRTKRIADGWAAKGMVEVETPKGVKVVPVAEKALADRAAEMAAAAVPEEEDLRAGLEAQAVAAAPAPVEEVAEPEAGPNPTLFLAAQVFVAVVALGLVAVVVKKVWMSE